MSASRVDPVEARFMRLAIEKGREGIAAGQSPFGACIVRGSDVVSCAHNVVWASNDITAHAEVTAIRAACAALGTIDLSDCVIYSTCEPCPMCFGACHWAHLSRIVFGASIADAAAIGFRELSVPNDTMKRLGGSPLEICGGFLAEECRVLFSEWVRRGHTQTY
jgi:tRNA(Arg) A34 adenosine deaminase TadA